MTRRTAMFNDPHSGAACSLGGPGPDGYHYDRLHRDVVTVSCRCGASATEGPHGEVIARDGVLVASTYARVTCAHCFRVEQVGADGVTAAETALVTACTQVGCRGMKFATVATGISRS